MINKVLRKIGNRSRYVAHWVTQGKARCSYEEFIRTDFDRRYGVETTEWVRMDEIATESSSKSMGNFYVPSDPELFRMMVRRAGVDARRFTLVDLGCGKGRMLITAAEAGFRRVIGVEFCEKMSIQARENVKRYRERFRPAGDIVVENIDATEFIFPNEPLVVFFFNSFGGEVLRRVLANLERSLKAHPREMYFLWNGPQFYPEMEPIVESCGAMERVEFDSAYAIYRNRR